MNDTLKIGVGLTAFGTLFTILGVLMLFDRGLLAMGNILFLSGVTLSLGVARSVSLFTARRRIRGSVLFFAGFIAVLVGWTFVGFFLEAFGFLNLFGDFFPVAFAFLRNVPVIGPLFNNPIFERIAARFGTGLPV